MWILPEERAVRRGWIRALCARLSRRSKGCLPSLPYFSVGRTAYNRKNRCVKRERLPMADEEMDIYPIEHKGKVYSIITSFDMTFREVRGMLDWLSEQKAFSLTPEDEFMGPGKIFHCDVEGVTFEVDVHGEEVVVYSRSPASCRRGGSRPPYRLWWML